MLCEQCQQRPATVHITKIVNNQKSQMHLCEECAREYHPPWTLALHPSFSLPQFLAGLMQHESEAEPRVERRDGLLRCDYCGLTYEEFRQTGRLGCSQCYENFRTRLEPLLRRVHGSSMHTGKVPRRGGGKLRVRHDIEQLRADLAVLVTNEEFEKAAYVRDRIRELEKQLQAEGGI